MKIEEPKSGSRGWQAKAALKQTVFHDISSAGGCGCETSKNNTFLARQPTGVVGNQQIRELETDNRVWVAKAMELGFMTRHLAFKQRQKDLAVTLTYPAEGEIWIPVQQAHNPYELPGYNP